MQDITIGLPTEARHDSMAASWVSANARPVDRRIATGAMNAANALLTMFGPVGWHERIVFITAASK
jgi:hypothetical protein